ncbi:MAG: cobalamin biosynthesis protein [Spirochaetales bacterium]|nr:cobalamin biosynthesis protein [Spirochaetales bacterium]
MICGMIIVLALIMDLVFGDPPNKLHTVVWMGSYIKKLWGKRPKTGASKLFFYGIFISLSGMIIFSIPLLLTRLLPFIVYTIVQAMLLKISFSLKNLFRAAKLIEKSLEEGNIKEARRLTSFHLVSRPTEELDEEKISAAVIGSVSENLTDSLTSPLLYYTLMGLPSAWGYRYINTCDAMIGYRKDDYEWGGKFAARLDDVLNFVPARLTALAIILTALPSGNIFRVMNNTRKWQKATPSPNSGWSMSAMAAVLDVRLEKVDYYILNTDGRLPSEKDIRLCVRKSRAAAIIIIVLIILIGGLLHAFV